MKALTLTQPWATLVAIGAKRFETRSWSTAYQWPLAIHAAKGLGPVGGKRGLIATCGQIGFREALSVARLSPTDLPLGQIVAVCDLAQSAPTESVRRYLESVGNTSEIQFGDYSLGRYAFELVNVREVGPIPVAGALGLWNLPAGLDLPPSLDAGDQLTVMGALNEEAD